MYSLIQSKILYNMVSMDDKNDTWVSRPYKKYSNSSNDNLSTDSNLDEDDDDSQMIRLNPIRPSLRWKDAGFQFQTMEALNQMRRNRHFCDVTLQVRCLKYAFLNNVVVFINIFRQSFLTLYYAIYILQIGQQDIPAHRVVLAAASPYLMELFSREDIGFRPSRKEVFFKNDYCYKYRVI